jgi:hypothetical protein
MRSFLKIVSVAGLGMMLAASVQAAQFTGNISFALSTLPGLVASGSGSGASAPGLVTIATAGWAATGPTLITLDPTAAAPLTALNILLTAPGPCSFTASGGQGGGLGGPCGLGGTANALVGGGPFLVVPFVNPAGTQGIGLGGQLTFGIYGSYIDAQIWTTGQVPVTVGGATLTTENGALIFTTGYDNRTPGGNGTVQLVSPSGLMSTLGGNLPQFATLTLDFVPEPGELLLMGSGIASLVLLGLMRMRR